MLRTDEARPVIALFRNSLRNWQANYKAQRAEGADGPVAAPMAAAPAGAQARRTNRLVGRSGRRRAGHASS